MIVAANQWFDKSILTESSIKEFYFPSVNLENLEKFKKEFFKNPEDVLLRSFSSILQNISGRYYAPRGKKIKKMILLLTTQRKAQKTTLGGCVIEKVNETVIISKE